MSVATTSALLTVEEYLKTVYRPDCDFVDGELEERNVGEHDHGYMQILIGAWFLRHRRVCRDVHVFEDSPVDLNLYFAVLLQVVDHILQRGLAEVQLDRSSKSIWNFRFGCAAHAAC